jgi:hypothetical protein
MPRAKQLFTERDLARAFKAASRAGVQVERVIVDKATGNIEVIAAQPATPRKKKIERGAQSAARAS